MSPAVAAESLAPPFRHSVGCHAPALFRRILIDGDGFAIEDNDLPRLRPGARIFAQHEWCRHDASQGKMGFLFLRGEPVLARHQHVRITPKAVPGEGSGLVILVGNFHYVEVSIPVVVFL